MIYLYSSLDGLVDWLALHLKVGSEYYADNLNSFSAK